MELGSEDLLSYCNKKQNYVYRGARVVLFSGAVDLSYKGGKGDLRALKYPKQKMGTSDFEA